MAGIRIAVVSYIHEPLEITDEGGTQSIGDTVNQFINASLKEGSLVSSFTIDFEENDQYKMRDMYHKHYGNDAEAVPVHDYTAKKKAVDRKSTY